MHIWTDAAQAFADVFAWASPFMGPFAVIPAAAAFALVGGATALIPSFDVGAWERPGDMIAKVHKGETILPAGPAGDFRSMMAGGSTTTSGDTNYNYNPVIHGYQPVDVMAELRRNSREFFRFIGSAQRNAIPIPTR